MTRLYENKMAAKMAALDLNAYFSAFSKVMAAETGSSYNFGCRIDINAIPTAKIGFPGTANALAANRKCYTLSQHPQITNDDKKLEVVITTY
jgi:hypothetical protein